MYKGKKVLLVGLGILGGGLSMAKFLIKEGAILRIIDKNPKENFTKEIKALSKSKVSYYFGDHRESDILWADIVVCNPAVPYFAPFPSLARTHNKVVLNDFSLFQEYLKYKNDSRPQVWITGTRGKTTTTLWTKHLLGDEATLGGNIVGNSLQKIGNSKGKYFVLETSNYQLEYPLVNPTTIPEVAVLTNIFTDHINRHGTFEEYKRVKHTVFAYQQGTGILLLNKKEKSVKDIMQANIQDISKIDISKFSTRTFPAHQQTSLSFAIATAKYFGVSDKDIKTRIKTLPFAPMRQEFIKKVAGISYINDSASTSPDALLVALDSYPDAVAIIGGTNANLDFKPLISYIKKYKDRHFVFLAGTATDEILMGLKLKDPLVLTCMQDAVFVAEVLAKKAKSKIVLLSPGAKSFGLFKNEFDRGEKFNKVVNKK